MQTKADNQGNQNEGCFYLLIETKKANGFRSLRVNCHEIYQVTPKCQIDFFGKTFRQRSKTEQVNITIAFYIFEIV